MANKSVWRVTISVDAVETGETGAIFEPHGRDRRGADLLREKEEGAICVNRWFSSKLQSSLL